MMQMLGFIKYVKSMAKKKVENEYSVILDSSFMIRMLNASDKLHSNALGYFKYFLEHDVPMYFSTVSVAEYCVKGDFYDLPFQNIRILPFNILHAKEAGKFASALYNGKKKNLIEIPDRLIIPNDSKLFAQGSIEKDIKYFVTSDVKSKNVIQMLRKECGAKIEHLDINKKHSAFWGLLDFEQ